MDSVIGLGEANTGLIKSLDDAPDDELKEAWRKCREIAKRAAGNFYYAFIFMPKAQRRGIEAVYAFCRLGDDAVDDECRDRAGLLARLQQRLDLCYRGLYNDLQTLALSHAVRQFGFERRHFDELLSGVESDLTVTRYPTFSELRYYCYRVASTIGFLCLKIFGCDTVKSRQYAENLGIAMQITNILRDLKEDYERGRIYLPQEDLEKYGIAESELLAPSNRERLIELVRWEAERADGYFEKADSYLSHSLSKTLFPARIMGAIYRRILDKIRGLRSFNRRAELSGKEKLRIARSVFRETFSL